MDDPIVEFLEGLGLEQKRFRLGTPDLAAASKFVTDEHQHRTPSGCRDAGEGRNGGHRQAADRQGTPVQHERSMGHPPSDR
jgi:hypothetical protein